MQHTYIELSGQDIDHPNCAKCGVPTWLTRIESHDQEHDQQQGVQPQQDAGRQVAIGFSDRP